MKPANEHVRLAIVIVVADGHRHIVARARQTCFLRDVRENAVAVVAEKTIGNLGSSFFSVSILAPFVKKISGRPSLL